MSGKSALLRQAGLLVVMAQIGCYVPATEANMGLVDKLFTKVGASDNLAAGESTFMVEMQEMATILHHMTQSSLLLLDEIGRGTSTYDGISLAWAIAAYLHEHPRHRPMTLFATHYHELNRMAEKYPRIAKQTMRVAEWEGTIIFLHEVIEGAADRSYGIQVAKLAGLPGQVIERARHVLTELEKTERENPIEKMIDDLPLFASLRAAPPPVPADPKANVLAEALDGLDPDAMSPREALDALYRLKALKRGG